MKRFCGGCGRPREACPDGCATALAFDPPRWCTTCGHRLDVQVFPVGTRSACKTCRVRAARTKGA